MGEGDVGSETEKQDAVCSSIVLHGGSSAFVTLSKPFGRVLTESKASLHQLPID